jgi:uncharacterized repeat protein (TIGR03803 family)
MKASVLFTAALVFGVTTITSCGGGSSSSGGNGGSGNGRVQYSLQILRSFSDLNDANGRGPSQPVILDSAGNVYGSNLGAGLYGKGVVFKLAPSSSTPWPETVLYPFTGGVDGGVVSSPLIFDSHGNLYGATSEGGDQTGCTIQENGPGCGVIFRLTPTSNGYWTETVLYAFAGGTDGAGPGWITFGSDGNLYGTTGGGGDPNGCVEYGLVPGCGVVFRLIPTASGPWQEQVLYAFTGEQDGAQPTSAVLDSAGNIYGMTYLGGQVTNSACPVFNGFAAGCGVVFRLTPGAGGTWTESVIYSFTGGADGNRPQGGIIRDSSSNLYGTTFIGGHFQAPTCGAGCGVVFRLSPSGSSWSQTVLYSFTGAQDGASPAGLALNAQGVLFGSNGGSGMCGCGGCGTIYQLTPAATLPWTLNVLTQLTTDTGTGPNPVIVDAANNVYGTAYTCGPNGGGTAFELVPQQ